MEKQLQVLVCFDREDVREALRMQGIEPAEVRIQAALHNLALGEAISQAVRPYCLQALDVLIGDYL